MERERWRDRFVPFNQDAPLILGPEQECEAMYMYGKSEWRALYSRGYRLNDEGVALLPLFTA